MPSDAVESHAAAVEAWLANVAEHGSSVEILELFRAALEAVWLGAVTALGPVTLTAIAERVLEVASDRHPFLAAVKLRLLIEGDAAERERLEERLAAVPRSDLLEGLRFGLVELLSVIGRLTAEILRASLHAALAAVVPLSDEARATHRSQPFLGGARPRDPS